MKSLGFNFYICLLAAILNLNSAIHHARMGSMGMFILDAILFSWMIFIMRGIWRDRNATETP